MESMAGSPLKCSIPKARVMVIVLSMVLCSVTLFLLQLRYLKPKLKDFYSFEVKDARGRTVSLEKYRGKVSLVVNVASYCQHAVKNYLLLQELQREFGSYHFNVLAFPCNQFGDSEPHASFEIEDYLKSSYEATFPIFHKIKILGSEGEPAFRFLIDSSRKEPKWNFWKYLVNPDGKVVKVFRPEESLEPIKKGVAALVRQIIIKKKEDL